MLSTVSEKTATSLFQMYHIDISSMDAYKWFTMFFSSFSEFFCTSYLFYFLFLADAWIKPASNVRRSLVITWIEMFLWSFFWKRWYEYSSRTFFLTVPCSRSVVLLFRHHLDEINLHDNVRRKEAKVIEACADEQQCNSPSTWNLYTHQGFVWNAAIPFLISQSEYCFH